MYVAMGDTITRFFSVTPRTRKGVNMGGTAALSPRVPKTDIRVLPSTAHGATLSAGGGLLPSVSVVGLSSYLEKWKAT